MDKRKRDSNSPPSSSSRENHLAKRAREDSPDVVSTDKERQDERLIPSERPLVKSQLSLSDRRWLFIIGPDVPPEDQSSAYTISGWRAFVDAMAINISEGNSDMYDGHLNLFIACANVFNCSPISLLSPLQGLYCDAPTSDQTSDDGAVSLWSQTPIRLLTQILTHPVLRGNKYHLATILQYAVILRTDDRRPWVMALQYPTPGGTLADLQRRIEATKKVDGLLTRSVRDLHRFARATNFFMESSVLSDIMYSLERTIERPATPDHGTREHLGVPLYQVTAGDIDRVNYAISASELNGIYSLPTTDECYRQFLENTKMSDDEPDFTQLAEFYYRTWHYEQRKVDSSIRRNMYESINRYKRTLP
ncbi:hypothetical protein FGADI_12248 [Fusarium gaditjirri]|uniref:Uncharacterized protein n=1 Tax=Fusarium gaditjirri TaxID=282569 RepID=A0A8H4WPE3_9HYPO|nr:hypothetical protein FGADI_12248 [Fusarium gaditjirri]